MICYKFYGFDAKGNNTNGYINCDSAVAAKKLLRKKGIYLYKSHSAEQEANGLLGKLRFLESIPISDKGNALWQLSMLLSSHVPINTALEHLSTSLKNPKLKRVFALIHKDVCNGMELSAAFAQHPCFGSTLPELMKCGETSGCLPVILQRFAQTMFYTSKLTDKVLSILAYPAFLASIILFFSTGLLIFIIPTMCDIFIQNGIELPALTRFLLNLSYAIKHYWHLVPLSIIGFFAFIKWRCQQQRCLRILSRIFFSIPLVGAVFHIGSILRFTKGLSLMLSGGTHLPEAILSVSRTVSNILMQDALTRVHAEICKGVSLTQALQRENQFPPLLTCMLATGEKSGNLEHSLRQATLIYEEQLESRIAIATALLEPVVMLMMGIIIGILVFALVLPMAKMVKFGG